MTDSANNARSENTLAGEDLASSEPTSSGSQIEGSVPSGSSTDEDSDLLSRFRRDSGREKAGTAPEEAASDRSEMTEPEEMSTNGLMKSNRLRELEESLSRLEKYATNAYAESTTRAYASDLKDFRHWCKRMDREWMPATPETVGLYLGAKAEDLSLSTLERRLAAISSVHEEEGHESPASVTEGPLKKIWSGIVRKKTRQKDGAPPLLVEDLKTIIKHLPRYSADEEGPTGQLTLTSLRDRALLLVGWTGALRRSELVALTTEDIQFMQGKGVNIHIRKSKTDQGGEGLTKGIPYGSNSKSCPVNALRQWLKAAEDEVEGSFEGDIFRRFYRGESIGESAMTAQYVSTVLKRHAESAGLDPEKYSSHSLRAGFITQAIRAGESERRVKEHSGHSSWEAFNQYVKEAGTFRDNPAEGIGL